MAKWLRSRHVDLLARSRTDHGFHCLFCKQRPPSIAALYCVTVIQSPLPPFPAIPHSAHSRSVDQTIGPLMNVHHQMNGVAPVQVERAMDDPWSGRTNDGPIFG